MVRKFKGDIDVHIFQGLIDIFRFSFVIGRATAFKFPCMLAMFFVISTDVMPLVLLVVICNFYLSHANI